MNWGFHVIVEIEQIEMKLLLIEVLCMPIEVRKLEEVEKNWECFSLQVWDSLNPA